MAACWKLCKGQTVFAADKRTAIHTPAFQKVRQPSRAAQTSRSSQPASSVVCQVAATAPAAAFKGDLLNTSYYPTSLDAANTGKRWYLVDADGQTLGRLATMVAMYIRGKHLPTYSPSMDMGAYVVVINAEKVKVTGAKFSEKTYFNHVNGRPGSYRMETFKDLQQRLPERIIERAVKGMLPKGRLGRDIRLHLKVFKGPNHEHGAQQPTDITKQVDAKPREGPGAKLLAAKKLADPK